MKRRIRFCSAIMAVLMVFCLFITVSCNPKKDDAGRASTTTRPSDVMPSFHPEDKSTEQTSAPPTADNTYLEKLGAALQHTNQNYTHPRYSFSISIDSKNYGELSRAENGASSVVLDKGYYDGQLVTPISDTDLVLAKGNVLFLADMNAKPKQTIFTAKGNITSMNAYPEVIYFIVESKTLYRYLIGTDRVDRLVTMPTEIEICSVLSSKLIELDCVSEKVAKEVRKLCNQTDTRTFSQALVRYYEDVVHWNTPPYDSYYFILSYPSGGTDSHDFGKLVDNTPSESAKPGTFEKDHAKIK